MYYYFFLEKTSVYHLRVLQYHGMINKVFGAFGLFVCACSWGGIWNFSFGLKKKVIQMLQFNFESISVCFLLFIQ